MKTPTWRRDARRLEERQRGDPPRRVKGQLEGDRPTIGVTDDVGALDLEVVQQSTRVGGLLGECRCGPTCRLLLANPRRW